MIFQHVGGSEDLTCLGEQKQASRQMGKRQTQYRQNALSFIAGPMKKQIPGQKMAVTIRYHEGDISVSDAARYTGAIAIDTETLGLIPRRDRLCVVQLSCGDGSADVIRIAPGQTQAPNLVAMLEDPTRQKIFHYGRFDIAVLFHTFGVTTTPVFCTKIASRLTRTYTDRHGLKDNQGNAGDRYFQGTAIIRLGSREIVSGATGICRVRRALPACPARQAERTSCAGWTR
jgi:hypothetical protein